jgi:hypothetical protein
LGIVAGPMRPGCNKLSTDVIVTDGDPWRPYRIAFPPELSHAQSNSAH